MVSDPTALLKPVRAPLVLAAVSGYGLVCAYMARPAGPDDLYGVLGAWILGLGGLLALERYVAEPVPVFKLLKALWLNLGAVVLALFVPPEVRLLLLTVPLFGVLYAALHLSRLQVALVTGVTWLGYLLGSLALPEAPADGAEGRLVLAFSLMLVAMFFMAAEVTSLRQAFERRRDGLDEAVRKLADLAMRDDLTGLYNRRYISEVLTRQKALGDRGNVGFTLCYCDLDFFKRVNDRFGHQRGDDVLRGFGRIAEQVVRSVDFVGRFGGEEFVLVLVDADAEEARRVVERLAHRTRKLVVDPTAPDCRLTVSVGIAEFVPGETIESVIQRADRALYQAKSTGRDRIVVG